MISGNTVRIKKHSGEYETFDVNKLISSLRHSLADEDIIKDIIQNVMEQIEDGMSTKIIYQLAFKMLRGKSRISASKYKLKKALMELGPSGFPFERLVGKLLSQEGFQTRVGMIVQGDCVQHELDVVAERDNRYLIIECKYHSD